MLDNYKFDFKLYKNILGKICHNPNMCISYHRDKISHQIDIDTNVKITIFAASPMIQY